MTFTPRPHDLLWLNNANALLTVEEAWVATQWHPGLPVVVRRDVNENHDIPVGVRGMKREQRAAAKNETQRNENHEPCVNREP